MDKTGSGSSEDQVNKDECKIVGGGIASIYIVDPITGEFEEIDIPEEMTFTDEQIKKKEGFKTFTAYFKAPE